MSINDIMDDFEDGEKVIMVHGEPKKIREVLDSILEKDKHFSEG